MIHKFILVSAMVAISIFSSCRKKTISQERKTAVSENSNEDTVEDKFYYVMENEEDFLHKLRKLKIGDSYSTIIGALGKPTYDHSLAPKRSGTAPPVRMLDYYIRKYRKNLANERYDLCVIMVLDADDNLKSIASSPGDWLKKWHEQAMPD